MTQIRIKDICTEKSISQKDLAEKIGISATSLSRIVTGDQKPSFDTLEKIAAALDVEIVDLFAKKSGFTAFIDYRGTLYRCNSIDELEGLIKRLKTTAEN